MDRIFKKGLALRLAALLALPWASLPAYAGGSFFDTGSGTFAFDSSDSSFIGTSGAVCAGEACGDKKEAAQAPEEPVNEQEQDIKKSGNLLTQPVSFGTFFPPNAKKTTP